MAEERAKSRMGAGLLGIFLGGLVEGILILLGKIDTDAKGVPLKD